MPRGIKWWIPMLYEQGLITDRDLQRLNQMQNPEVGAVTDRDLLRRRMDTSDAVRVKEKRPLAEDAERFFQMMTGAR